MLIIFIKTTVKIVNPHTGTKKATAFLYVRCDGVAARQVDNWRYDLSGFF
jgi:hypothetical protein